MASPSASDRASAGAAPTRNRRAARRTVAKVVATTWLVLALVTALGVVLAYRHYNANLTVANVGAELGRNRPAPLIPAGPSGPVNILIMGSDNRNAPGDHIDNLTGIGKRSDTTILLHLSADRRRAYAVSIPRDSIVHRAACYSPSGKQISPPTSGAMWNDAFNIGGPGCTVRQFEQLTHIRVDHFIVADFAGFRSMVDAIGGVTVCLPHPVVDPVGHIYLPAGTHTFTGAQALSYVRERHDLGDGSDLGRIKRQQAFVASMAHEALSAHTLENPIRLARFLDAATKSLTVDPGLKNLSELVGLAYQFRHIGLNKIQLLTTPWQLDPTNPDRVVWTPLAHLLWRDLAHDRVLPRSLLSGALNARQIPGVTGRHPHPHSSLAQQNLSNGLCP